MTGPECAFRQLLTYERKWYLKVLLPIAGATIVLFWFSVFACYDLFCSLRGRKRAKKLWAKIRTSKQLKTIERSVLHAKDPLANDGKIVIPMDSSGQKKRRKKSVREQQLVNNLSNAVTQATSILLTMTYFLFVLVSKTALAPFNCVPTRPPTGRMFMADRPLEECFREGRLQMRLTAPAVLFLVFYTFGFPVFIIAIFLKHKEKIQADQMLRAKSKVKTRRPIQITFFRRRFSRLYYQFQPQYYFWILILLARKFFICLIGVLFRSAPTFPAGICDCYYFLMLCAPSQVPPIHGRD